MMQLQFGTKGELIIPKKIRDQIGFSKSRIVILEVKDEGVLIRLPVENIAKKWAKRADLPSVWLHIARVTAYSPMKYFS